MQNWVPVRDFVAQHTQTVIFERAGFGNSEGHPSPRSARELAKEFHTALENAEVAFPPHSMTKAHWNGLELLARP